MHAVRFSKEEENALGFVFFMAVLSRNLNDSCVVHLFWSRCGLCEQCSFPSCLSVRFSLITGCLLAPTRTPYCGFSCLPPRLLLLLSSAGFLWCVSHVFGCVPPLVFALAVPPQPLSGPQGLAFSCGYPPVALACPGIRPSRIAPFGGGPFQGWFHSLFISSY